MRVVIASSECVAVVGGVVHVNKYSSLILINRNIGSVKVIVP